MVFMNMGNRKCIAHTYMYITLHDYLCKHGSMYNFPYLHPHILHMSHGSQCILLRRCLHDYRPPERERLNEVMRMKLTTGSPRRRAPVAGRWVVRCRSVGCWCRRLKAGVLVQLKLPGMNCIRALEVLCVCVCVCV